MAHRYSDSAAFYYCYALVVSVIVKCYCNIKYYSKITLPPAENITKDSYMQSYDYFDKEQVYDKFREFWRSPIAGGWGCL